MRLIVALLALLCGVFLLLQHSWFAVPFLALAPALIWDYFRRSAVWQAFAAFRRGDLAAVRWWLEQVRFPKLLNRPSQAYYHWLRGALEATDSRLQAAKVHLLVAASGQLRTENDRSLVQCLLAEVNLQAGAPEVARDHLRLAESLAHYGEVDRLIDHLRRRLGPVSVSGGEDLVAQEDDHQQEQERPEP